MRKLRWPIAILILLIVVAGAIALRTPPDELDGLRPFVVGDETLYMPSGTAPLPRSSTPSRAFSHRIIFVKGINQEQLVSILSAHAKRFGWNAKVSTGSTLTFEAESSNPNPINSIIAHGEVSPHIEGVSHHLSAYSIDEFHELSIWDVVRYRLRNRGRSPFPQY